MKEITSKRKEVIECERQIEIIKSNKRKRDQTLQIIKWNLLMEKLNSDIKYLNRKLKSLQGAPINIASKVENTYDSNATNHIESNWGNITFYNNRIEVKIEGTIYEKHVSDSNKYLNDIFGYFSFYNVPKLKIIVEGREIKKILNEDVLLYHIEFLKNVAPYIGKHPKHPLNLETWSRYKKVFYNEIMPNLYHKKTLIILRKYFDSNHPIVPVGETIISENKLEDIKITFLFPLITRNGYILAWESIEEDTATYLFKVNHFCIKELQPIYDYISGTTPNKRDTLIQNKELQKKLGLIKRVMHNDINNWASEIKTLVSK